MGRTSLPLFQINQYQNQNQNKAVSGLKGVLRLGTAFYNLLFLCVSLSFPYKFTLLAP